MKVKKQHINSAIYITHIMVQVNITHCYSVIAINTLKGAPPSTAGTRTRHTHYKRFNSLLDAAALQTAGKCFPKP